MSDTISARDGALAKLAAEAARFTNPSVEHHPSPRPLTVAASPATETTAPSILPPPRSRAAGGSPAGYVPVAVAPERGNTRPVVPVDGRLHMRMAQPTVDALDVVVRDWRAREPVAWRDLERATLVRVGVALVLADVAAHGTAGAVGEAIRAALDPAVRHTDLPLPDLTRWLRESPAGDGPRRAMDQPADAEHD